MLYLSITQTFSTKCVFSLTEHTGVNVNDRNSEGSKYCWTLLIPLVISITIIWTIMFFKVFSCILGDCNAVASSLILIWESHSALDLVTAKSRIWHQNKWAIDSSKSIFHQLFHRKGKSWTNIILHPSRFALTRFGRDSLKKISSRISTWGVDSRDLYPLFKQSFTVYRVLFCPPSHLSTVCLVSLL